MLYIALGDSISIDDYSGVANGGAASQFAARIRAAEFRNLAYDGCFTSGVLEVMSSIDVAPDVVTLTVGGNDFLRAAFLSEGETINHMWHDAVSTTVARINLIADGLYAWQCPVIVNTIYDPTSGNSDQIPEMADLRAGLRAVNTGIRSAARRRKFLLADLEAPFTGHGSASADPWIVNEIEPSYAGSTAIAALWDDLWTGHQRDLISGSCQPG